MDQMVRGLSDQVRSLQLQIQTQQQPPSVPQTSTYAPSNLSSGGHRGSPGGPLPPQPIQTTASNLQHPLPHQHVSTSSHLRQGIIGGGFNSSSNPLPALLSQQPPPHQHQPQHLPSPPSNAQQQSRMLPPQPTSWQGPIQPPMPQQAPVGQLPQLTREPATYAPQPVQPIPTYATQQPYERQGSPLKQAQSQVPIVAPQPKQVIAPPSELPPAEDWDEMFLAALGRDQPITTVRALLARCDPNVILPSQRELSPLSQAVVLTMIHRLAESLNDLSPQDEALRSSLWWLQRAAYSLDATNQMIEAYLEAVLSQSQQNLSLALSRFAAYPEFHNTISNIQHTLSYAYKSREH
ncbi:hypothetical protein DL93DRAFT_2169872 [Clavulina sp. PMI_390]|nr:hypothetical protein DL93DRAFT_2169872 [Clavulina sp. PMI_390]